MNILHVTVHADIGGGPKHILGLIKALNLLGETKSFVFVPGKGENDFVLQVVAV